MDNEVLIKVDNVSKKFCRDLRRSLIYGVHDIAGEMLGYYGRNSKLRKDEFWALDNISFELKRGECLGLIGQNGSGKSTMLKLLNGLIKPDKGKITVKGRVGALIELGAGFNPILTGRENIYINGTVLGFTKKEINKKFDAIVAFSEIKEFIDMPVQSYSSGMHVRLGFAIAAQMEPDILLLDEILAVGDVSFRSKCYNRISELQKTCATIFVSHNIPAVARISSQCLVLKKGVNVSKDIPSKAIHEYFASLSNGTNKTATPSGTGEAKVYNFKLTDEKNNETLRAKQGAPLTISFDTKISNLYKNFRVNISFADQSSNIIAQCDNKYQKIELINKSDCLNKISLTIPKLLFNPGYYKMSLVISDDNLVDYYYICFPILEFQVVGDFVTNSPILLDSKWTILQ